MTQDIGNFEGDFNSSDTTGSGDKSTETLTEPASFSDKIGIALENYCEETEERWPQYTGKLINLANVYKEKILSMAEIDPDEKIEEKAEKEKVKNLVSADNIRSLNIFLNDELDKIFKIEDYKNRINFKLGLHLKFQNVVSPYQYDEVELNTRRRIGQTE